MLVTAIMTTFGMATLGFYVRFLVALCKERKTKLTGYWVRLRLDSDEEGQSENEIKTMKRAA